MSIRTEPYRKYVADDEKSKFYIFLAEMVSLETWWGLFLEMVF